MKRWFVRLATGFGLLLGILVVAAAAPIVVIETRCDGGSDPTTQRPVPLVDDPGYRRAEGDSFMTYPEWYIVHAYRDLANVTRISSESRYDYLQPVGTYWVSLCSATRTARTIGPLTFDQRVTDYIIGVSFSAEMLIQGAYERSIGAATARWRGSKTPEDLYNQRFLEDYATFLQQTPWYAYPFSRELEGLWRDVRWSWHSPVRSAERRIALSLQFGIKAVYAVVIGKLAGYSPADLTIESVVRGNKPDERVTAVRDLGAGRSLVRTARYEAFSDILRGWARDNVEVLEIAGNHRILTTILAPKSADFVLPGAREIFRVAIQSKPDWTRIGLDTDVPRITEVINEADRRHLVFEHAYDY